ncbi:MAG TPA: ABC transporter [Polyangia bacterium]
MAIALWPSLAYAIGLLFVYVGERVIQSGRASAVVTILGLLGVLGAMLWRGLPSRKGPEGTRAAGRMLLLLYGLGALALVLHFVGGDVGGRLLGRPPELSMPRLAIALSALWPALLLAGTLPVLLVELSLAGMAHAPVLDTRRLRAAMWAGLGTALTLVFCFSVAYVTAERNAKADLAYFRTTRAGSSTKKLVAALDQPVQVTLFFPPANEVAEELTSYFAELTRISSQLTVTRMDQAVEPARAHELGVSGNGVIVVARDKRREQIAVPIKLESARGKLRVLDQEVYKRLVIVSRGTRTAYFVQGHEERTFNSIGETDRRGTVRLMRDLLSELGFNAKELGMAQGLGNDVPSDAGLVLMLGPKRPLMPAETDSLLRYFNRKGRLLVALDPEGGEAAADLLAGLSLRFNPTVLANDQIFWARTRQKTDRIGIATGSYSSHASVEALSPYGVRLPFVLLGAGSLARPEKPAADAPNVAFPLRAEANTWNDLNGNFEFDAPKEVRKAYELAAAVSKGATPEEEGRAFVLADSDALDDELIANRANSLLAVNLVRWLAGDERLSGTISNEEDVPVRHTRKQDVAWFYASVFACPALVLGLGFIATRRRRASRRAPGQPTPPSEGSR